MWYNATLVGMYLGRHGAFLCGHQAKLISMNLSQHGTLVGMSLGWHGAVLYGHHATLVGMSPGRHVATMSYYPM